MNPYVIAALSAASLSVSAALTAAELPPKEQRYPVVNDAASIRAAYGSDFVAIRMVNASVEGKVVSLELSPRSRPAIELLLAAEPRTTIWVVFPDKLDPNDVRPGSTIRARGWLLSSSEWAQASKQLQLQRPNPALLLSACIVPMPEMNIIADRKWVQTCAEWQNGFVPSPWAGH